MFGGSCYRVGGGNQVFDTASGICDAFGAHLPVVTSWVESGFVHRLAGADAGVWLGMRRVTTGNKQISSFEWVNGRTVQSVVGVKEEIGSSWDLCVRSYGDSWNDQNCGSKYRVVCEYELYPTCEDGLQNNGEEGVDCGGGVCPRCLAGRMLLDSQQLRVPETAFAPDGSDGAASTGLVVGLCVGAGCLAAAGGVWVALRRQRATRAKSVRGRKATAMKGVVGHGLVFHSEVSSVAGSTDGFLKGVPSGSASQNGSFTQAQRRSSHQSLESDGSGAENRHTETETVVC